MLRLEVREFRDLTRWRWVLTDTSGAVVADHEVRLDPADWQFEAFADLPFFLRWHAAPDRRAADEARIVGEVGEWIGSRVLGAVGPALLRRKPAEVRVVVPAGAGELLLRPLELAHVAGQPLAVQEVTLVMAVGSDAHGGTPIEERLRVLGLFSMPDGRRTLNLRRERRELVRLITGIAALGKAVDVRVLQYGVTREALTDVLLEGEGWDMVHLSGHGRPGSLLLETASGDSDQVDGAELADLLQLECGRIKLVTVSACWSAAVAAGEQRRLLGLPTSHAEGDVRSDVDTGTVPEALATGLAARLGCAVLAMRYTVSDEFAMALTEKLYELLISGGQPLGRALGKTLRDLSASSSPPGISVLSVVTPALFGEGAADLRLAAPDRPQPPDCDAGLPKMAGFPPQAARFVGRTGVMARTSAALAVRSGVPGILLHGMPGGGKTACAVELAYGHEHAFDHLVWYKAPDEGIAIDGSLTGFALTLERYLPDFQMAHELVTSERLSAFLPWLTELMERRRALIVIDNLESLLTGAGAGRDDQWGQVLAALTAHTGLGRVILTSRRVPVSGVTGLRVESVDALSADEALLLIRELPHLQALGRGKVPGVDPFASRQLARRAIEAARGHPKLLELAEGQAAHPKRLAALVEAGDQAWQGQGGLPDSFFSDEVSIASGDDYYKVLATWTKSVTDTLMPGERNFFWLLCCLEEGDRERPVIEPVRSRLRERLGHGGQSSGPDVALAALAARGLATIRPQSAEGHESYGIHPGIAAVGRDNAGRPFRDAVDTEAGSYWASVHQDASGESGNGTVDTRMLVRAGLAAVPYLLRQQRWTDAAALLGGAFIRDPSRANAAAVLPSIEQITRHDSRHTSLTARVMRALDPGAGESWLGGYLDTAVTAADYPAASWAAGQLAYLYLSSGRLAEALAISERKADYSRQAGLGPWTRLADQAQRLYILTVMGQPDQALAQVRRLRACMDALPATQDTRDPVPPWHAREGLLETGRDAARLLGRHGDALEMNAAVVASRRDRQAPVASIAQAKFNDYGPLLRLGRTSEALELLLECRQVFQDAGDIPNLAKVLSALADTEDRRGHGDAAVRLERDALRYAYLTGDVAAVAVGYHNLGVYLAPGDRQPVLALASHLAAAVIRALIGMSGDASGSASDSVQAAAANLRELGSAGPPRNIADLCDRLSGIPGTDLPGLIARLSPDPETTEATFRDLTTRAAAMAAEPHAEAARKDHDVA